MSENLTIEEIWKDIPNYENLYQVSNYGRIKSLSRTIVQKNRIINWPERILKCTNSKGYLGIKIYNSDGLKNIRVHRIVAQAFIPNPNNKPCVNHKNGIKTDNRVENLEWCTHSQNVQHAYDTGLTIPCFGDNSHSSKLTSQQIKEIRTSYKNKQYSQSKLSKIYQVGVSNINMILTNKTWKRVQI